MAPLRSTPVTYPTPSTTTRSTPQPCLAHPYFTSSAFLEAKKRLWLVPLETSNGRKPKVLGPRKPSSSYTAPRGILMGAGHPAYLACLLPYLRASSFLWARNRCDSDCPNPEYTGHLSLGKKGGWRVLAAGKKYLSPLFCLPSLGSCVLLLASNCCDLKL